MVKRGVVIRLASVIAAELGGLVPLALGAAAPTVLVEDWSKHTVGAKGIPEGWTGGQTWGSPAYDFAVVREGSGKALQLKSRADSSTISKAVKISLKDTPVLEWQWKAVALPAGGDARNEHTDDQAVQLYVTWERFPRLVRSRIIGYIWDSTAPAGTIIKSQKTGLITYVVVRSGPADVGKWLTEVRNVSEDYKRIYGEAPDGLDGMSIAIDSDDTKSSAEAYVGAIRFRTPEGR